MNELRLLAVGDISLAQKLDVNPFTRILSALEDKDILFGNLETALSERGNLAQKSVTLATSLWKTKYLVEAGFDVLNIANNHIMDRGRDGLEDTLMALSSAGIAAIGVGEKGERNRATILNKNGIRVGFLGYDQYGFEDRNGALIVRNISKSAVIEDIANSKSECDIVIVSLHWGMEYSNYPSPDQIAYARSFIDAGAAVVIGHHPHVPQGIEIYNKGLIVYSLGNFQFENNDNSLSVVLERSHSIIIAIRVGREGLLSYEVIPIVIDHNNMPSMAGLELAAKISEFIVQISEPLAKNSIDWKWWFDRISRNYLADSLKSWKKRISRYGILHLIYFFRWLFKPFVWRCFWTVLAGGVISHQTAVIVKDNKGIEERTVTKIPRKANVSR